MNYLKDPTFWNIITVLVPILTFLPTLIIEIIKWTRKKLKFEVIAITPLLPIGEALKDSVTILYEYVPVKNVYLVILKISNNGNVPIKPSDFIEPFYMLLSNETKILSFELIETVPKISYISFDFEEKFNRRSFVIKPLLLNPGYSFTFKMLLSNPEGKLIITPYSSIVGVKDFQYPDKPIIYKYSWFFVPMALGILSLFILRILSINSKIPLSQIAHPIYTPLLLILTLILGGTTFFLYYREEKRRASYIEKYLK